tara:strand:+ start:357 stop:521 length:165 start_codon:yes stop_codon:yes gene_type:complete
MTKPSKKNKKDFNLACLGLQNLKQNKVNTKAWTFYDLYFHGVCVLAAIKKQEVK